MNDGLNALMSLMLPFALLPLLIFSSSRKVMGDFVNNVFIIIAVSILSIVIITINLYFVSDFVTSNLPNSWWVFTLLALFFLYYMSLVFYLVSIPS